VTVTPKGRDAVEKEASTSEFSGAVIGSAIIGGVTLYTGEARFLILGRNTTTSVQIESDSYLPVAIQTGSWEGIYYPRSRE